MRLTIRSVLILLTIACFVVPAFARGRGPIGILVLKEHGVGTAAVAQPYVDRFVALAAKKNNWAAARGAFHTRRTRAEAYIQSQKPDYAILSLPAFLLFRKNHKVTVIGQVDVAGAGGRQYHIVSKTSSGLAGCKGKRLASDHADDPRFVDKVVGAGEFTLGDFQLVQTRRPLQTIRKLVKGQADCALIDDAQLASLKKNKKAQGVRAVWDSKKLPPMVVVAFPSANSGERDTFQKSLPTMCDGDGATPCREVGIRSFKTASDGDYASLIGAYDK